VKTHPTFLASDNRIVVQHLTHDPNVKGSSPVVATDGPGPGGGARMNVQEVEIKVFQKCFKTWNCFTIILYFRALFVFSAGSAKTQTFISSPKNLGLHSQHISLFVTYEWAR
jgi:hypothetical protein